jgi:FAD:protein FMN transferase
MRKTFSDLARHALNGPTMGTRWSALFHMPHDFDPLPAETALAAAVTEVDQQMSTWKADSDLNRLNAAAPGEWVMLPERLMTVLDAGLAIGKASGGAFDIAMGDAVAAWGFGPQEMSEDAIRSALRKQRKPAWEALELDDANRRARKHEVARFDLNGIAKGYGVDRLTEVARGFGIAGGLFAIDGELRALGTQPDGRDWTVAVEKPDPKLRAMHSVVELQDAAIATSGDYRHWVELGGLRLSHTMDPKRGMPLHQPPTSATAISRDCMSADAWATAMLVLGVKRGLQLAEEIGLSVLFLDGSDGPAQGCGAFATAPVASQESNVPPERAFS